MAKVQLSTILCCEMGALSPETKGSHLPGWR
jgi:hypothetical protein